ncbi:MAG: putative metalloprotease CJM1_0395 family protein [Gammaproteobacteria bacterium]|nr:putative metalloprotease CJM1_0395 family protein [Gammaproteobacteria bacterium]
MVEISSSQLLNPSRGSASARTASDDSNSVKSSSDASGSASSYEEKAASTEPSATEKREEKQHQQAEASQIQKLQSRDREVRSHEAAHIAAGGQHVTSGASFTYQRGPDGRLYAVGGEVSISTSAVPADPQATLAKAEVIRRAALAPADPSSQDLRVASDATRMASRARVDIAIQQRELQQMQAEAAKHKDPAADEPAESVTAVNLGSSGGYSSSSLASPAKDVFDIVA